MPIFALLCAACRHPFDAFCAAKSRHTQRCPVCRRRGTRIDWSRVTIRTERRFAGSESESVTQGFHPNEVQKARLLMPKSQTCIRDDGSVWFGTRSEERAFRRELRGVHAKAERAANARARARESRRKNGGVVQAS